VSEPPGGSGEPDLTTFPLVPHGHHYEDFEPDRELAHHWGRTMTSADSIAFSTATCAWNPMYLNAEYARAHGHPDLVINPMLVLCTAVGLSVEDLSESGGPFLGVDEAIFHRPVYPGDTITAYSRVVDKRESASRSGTGIVTWDTKVHNQRDELVLEYRRTNLVALRRS
jgi:itaconyl-CoA hydratase